MSDLTMIYDDDEDFADDDPRDLEYHVQLSRFVEFLKGQLAAIAEGEDEFDPEEFATRIQRRVLPRANRAGYSVASKDQIHALFQNALESVPEALKARVANEVLVLLSQLDAEERGTV